MKILKKIVNASRVRRLKKISRSNQAEIGKITTKKSKIICVGKNNAIILKDDVLVDTTVFDIHGNNNKIIINDKSVIRKSYFWICGDNNYILINERCVLNGSDIHVSDSTSLEIGSDSLIAANTDIRTTDIHKIVDENKNILNVSKNISIGKHCWICQGAKIFKGVEIGENSIVAAGAIVTKAIPENSLCGGVPAKVLKSQVNWER